MVRWSAVAASFAVALAAVLFGFRDLPMLDLPQHAVEVATWARWNELPPADREVLELNLRTPYLLAYGLARGLVPLLGVLGALKFVVWLAAIAQLGSLWLLARRLGHSPWLALLALPASFGFSFYFGFISFLLATPLVTFGLVLALGYSEDPRFGRGLALALSLTLTFFAHGFAFAIAVVSVGWLLAFEPALRQHGVLRRLAPLSAPIGLAAVWLASDSRVPSLQSWTIDGQRATHWPTMIVGAGTYRDTAAAALGVALLATLALAFARPRLNPARFSLLVPAALGYAATPEMLCGTALLYQRFVGFLLPAALLAFEPRAANSSARRVSAPLAAAVCTLWLVVFSVRLQRFNEEMSDFRAFTDRLPAGLKLRPVIYDQDSAAFPGVPAFVHASAYYHAEKGGLPAYSFAVQPLAVVRYKPGHTSTLAPGAEWQPRIDAANEAAKYDYFLLRGARAVDEPFADSPVPIVFDTCHGNVCGYYRARLAQGKVPRGPL